MEKGAKLRLTLDDLRVESFQTTGGPTANSEPAQLVEDLDDSTLCSLCCTQATLDCTECSCCTSCSQCSMCTIHT